MKHCKKYLIRTILPVLLCIGLLTGCGGGGNNSAPVQTPAPEQAEAAAAVEATASGPMVFQARYMDLEGNGLTSVLQNGTVVGDTLYYTSLGVTADHTPDGVTPEWPEQYWVYGPVLCRVGIDGSLERLPYSPALPEAESGINSGVLLVKLCAAADGTLWVLENRYQTRKGATGPDGDISDSTVTSENYCLVHLTADGTALSELPLDGLRTHPEAAAAADGNYSFSVSGMAQDNEGHICLAVSESYYSTTSSVREAGILALDTQTGAVVARFPMYNTPELMTALSDGTIAVLSYENGSEQIGTLDLKAQSFSVSVPVSGFPDALVSGADGQLYYSEGDSFYSLNLESAEAEKLFSWVDCDVAHTADASICVLADGRVVTTSGEQNADMVRNTLILLEPTDASQITEKKTMRLAVANLDPWTSKAVSRFNRSSTEYRIEVTDYSQFNNYSSSNEADWNAGITRLQTELIAGNIPDILDLTLLSADRLGAKGILVDLYPYIDSDPEVNRSDLLESVLAAFEEDGKLYQTVSNFYVLTTVGLRDRVGDSMGWTMDQFNEAFRLLREDNPESSPFQNFMTRDTILTFLLYLEMENYVDWGQGTCRLDSDSFTKLLEFVKSFPESFSWAGGDPDLDEDSKLLNGSQMMKQCNFTDFLSYQMNTAGMGGAPCTFVGYPTESGVGSMFAQVGSSYAISSACADKDAAWQFVRQLFLPEYQEQLSGYVFPTNRAVYEAMKQAAMSGQYERNPDGSYVLDDDGHRVEADLGSVTAGGRTYPLHPATAEEIALTEEIIASTTHALRLDDSLAEIIHEGAAAFFADQKSVDETVKLMQSRAMLYVNEQR